MVYDKRAQPDAQNLKLAKNSQKFSDILPVTSAYTVNLSSLTGNWLLCSQKHRQVGVVILSSPEGLNLDKNVCWPLAVAQPFEGALVLMST